MGLVFDDCDFVSLGFKMGREVMVGLFLFLRFLGKRGMGPAATRAGGGGDGCDCGGEE